MKIIDWKPIKGFDGIYEVSNNGKVRSLDKEVELILLKLKIVSEEEERGMYLCNKEHSKLLYDYITNLQQKNENAIELCKSLIIFWKKYTNDNSLEIGQLENIIGQLNGGDE